MSLSAALLVLRAVASPSLALPHATVPTFAQLPVPLDPLFASGSDKPPQIRAVVLDKDNTFAAARTNAVHPPYSATFAALRAAYPHTLVIVSNSAGSAADADGSAAARLSEATGVPVLRHAAQKPACGADVMAHLRARGVTHPSQVAVVGDRVATDVLMANAHGMRAVWVADGVADLRGVEGACARAEKAVVRWLRAWGVRPPPVGESVFE